MEDRYLTKDQRKFMREIATFVSILCTAFLFFIMIGVVIPDHIEESKIGYVINLISVELIMALLCYASGVNRFASLILAIMILLMISLSYGYHFRVDTPKSIKSRLKYNICQTSSRKMIAVRNSDLWQI